MNSKNLMEIYDVTRVFDDAFGGRMQMLTDRRKDNEKIYSRHGKRLGDLGRIFQNYIQMVTAVFSCSQAKAVHANPDSYYRYPDHTRHVR